MTAAAAADSEVIGSFAAEMTGAIGQWKTAGELIDLLRNRADALGITRLALDGAAGLPTGYSGKILSRKVGGQRMGIAALETLIVALGMQMIAVENPAAMRRFTDKIERRAYKKPDAGSEMPAQKRQKRPAFSLFRGNPDAAQRLRALQLIRQSSEDRSKAARHAAKIRWARHRAKESAGKAR